MASPLSKLALRIEQVQRENDYHWFAIPIHFGGGVVLWTSPLRIEGMASQAGALLLSSRGDGYEALVKSAQTGEVGGGYLVIGPRGHGTFWVDDLSGLFDCFE